MMDWMDIALRLAREGDTTAYSRRSLLDDQVRSSLESDSEETLRKVERDRRAGILG
jgi:hypothetical protein